MLLFDDFLNCIPTLVSFYFLIKHIDQSQSSTIELSSLMCCCILFIIFTYIIISKEY